MSDLHSAVARLDLIQQLCDLPNDEQFFEDHETALLFEIVGDIARDSSQELNPAEALRTEPYKDLAEVLRRNFPLSSLLWHYLDTDI